MGEPTARPFDGRVAIVTGASRGIGLAVAETLLARGARVCVTARKPDPLAAAVRDLGGNGTVIGVPGRADDADHQQEAVARTVEAFGRVDMLVNNAGINPVYGPVLDSDPGAAAKTFAVNVIAPIGWVRAAHHAWMGEHGGAVVNMASITSMHASPGIGLYGVSKAALIRLTVELAAELAPTVRVNAVAPAIVKTRFATPLYEGREDDVAATYPMRRLGVPADVAGAVAFLLSDEADWITGQTLVLDGGLSLTTGG
ncbi:MAG: glucose 1-dehydrogenase [Streptosporangiales bacterium]|nr:glucose 1-dehydrogenase [Streptosporangiales bacterium]